MRSFEILTNQAFWISRGKSIEPSRHASIVSMRSMRLIVRFHLPMALMEFTPMRTVITNVTVGPSSRPTWCHFLMVKSQKSTLLNRHEFDCKMLRNILGHNEIEAPADFLIRQCQEFAKLGMMGVTLLSASG